MFVNYECLQGRKPYQDRKLTPSEFKIAHENRDVGHQTLIEIMSGKDDSSKKILKKW